MELESDEQHHQPGDPGAVAVGMDAYTRHTDYALHIVTAATGDGTPSGCVVGFVTQCSIVPPRFLVCISKVNHTYMATEQAGAVALHLIGRDQVGLASLFAEHTGDVVDKFSRCEWHPGETGSPVLSASVAWLEALIIDRWSVGDHQALLVRPVAGGTGGGDDGVLTWRNSPDFHPGHPVGP
jgi:flavin reductase (DIM6/NTAB) family NADH-FMN oxidoreductase RutF